MERACITCAPSDAISSISSKVMVLILRADLTTRGSVVKIPVTSVKISHTFAFRATASATAVRSEPPRPSVVISPSGESPW